MIIWLTPFDITHPHYLNSKMFQEVDWLMNEKDPKTVVHDAIQANIGLYGFTKPDSNSIKPYMDYYYCAPIDSFEGDDKIIATFARVFNEKPLDFVTK